MGCNWKINVPLILVAIAQITALVFGIIEVSNPKHNWGYYNKHFNSNNNFNHINVNNHNNNNNLKPSCHHQHPTPPPSSTISPSPSPSTFGSSSLSTDETTSSSIGSSSIITSSSYDNSDSEKLQKKTIITTTFREPLWVEAGWKSWCGQFICGELNEGHGLMASNSALYGSVSLIVGSIIILAGILIVHINDLKRFMNGKLLIGLVATFILFMFAVTLASWIIWVRNFHAFVYSLDENYYITYGYCFVLAILGSSMEFFSFFLLFLSRWRSGMEIPIGDDDEDDEETVQYTKLQSIRLANLM